MRVEAKRNVGADSQTVWRFDSTHTFVEFSVRNFFLFTVRGRFTALDGTIVLDEAQIQGSAVVASIKAESIETGKPRRDAHLKSADFLDVHNFPNIQFQSSTVASGKDRDTLAITGSLTIRGKSEEVVLDVTELDRSRSPQGEEILYYIATTELDRFDFGIDYGRGVIDRRLKVTINVQASRPV